MRPDLTVVPLRGNVETRLRKLDEGVADATLLALAGLKRLGLADAATAVLDVDEFLPAVGQGAIAIETRADDARTRELLAAINHAETFSALAAERAFLAVLDGSCRTPIARPRDDLWRTASLSRHDREARRQRSLRDDARGRCRAMPNDSAPTPAAELKAAPAPDFFSVLTMRLLGDAPRARQRSAPPRRCARWGTRSCWRRCCTSKRSPMPISVAPPWAAVAVDQRQWRARGCGVIPGMANCIALAGACGRAAAAPTRRGRPDSPMWYRPTATPDDLARLPAQRFAGARPPLLYLAGEDRAGELAGDAGPGRSHRRGLPGRQGRTVPAGSASGAGAGRHRRRAAFLPP